jgi:CBS domain-containing protein
MRALTVADVMTTEVITVCERTPFKEIVRRMVGCGVSALPVVGADRRVLGVVSEGDMLLKEERPHPPIAAVLPKSYREGEKAAARTAAEVMSHPALTARPDESLRDVARRMHARKLKHLPVVDEHERLIGIVSRGDLLGPFLRSDAEIGRDVVELIDREPGCGDVRAEVREGVVALHGRADRRSQRRLLISRAQEIDGVVGVDVDVMFEVDDTAPFATYPYVH